FGRWQDLPLDEPATHLTADEAAAWCRWANRRLPSEAEWEMAALLRPEFRWGQVWEWTASRFAPYPGFAAHPYRDYSVPWFADRRVLRGASRACSPRIAHPRYRNFFTADRNDLHSGFRGCAR
ncbi:MAG: SUMF1/EgtB/PvdO family nonheme iron enzyme, partial [Casimicrobiaceae bacterium]